jgi:hypothetical protein
VLAGSSAAGADADGQAVARWVASLSAPVTFSPTYTVRGNHSISFMLPEGYGAGRDLFVVVDGVPSNRLTFDYDAPIITNLAPDRFNVSVGQLRLFVEGVNFCASPLVPSAGGCGSRASPPLLVARREEGGGASGSAPRAPFRSRARRPPP